jgi:hypothetical protein
MTKTPLNEAQERLIDKITGKVSATSITATYTLEIITGFQQTQRALNRKGSKGPLRAAIERICADLESPALELVLNVLENEDAMLDLFESLNDPIHITVQEVNRKRMRVYYRIRSGKERNISSALTHELA